MYELFGLLLRMRFSNLRINIRSGGDGKAAEAATVPNSPCISLSCSGMRDASPTYACMGNHM